MLVSPHAGCVPPPRRSIVLSATPTPGQLAGCFESGTARYRGTPTSTHFSIAIAQAAEQPGAVPRQALRRRASNSRCAPVISPTLPFRSAIGPITSRKPNGTGRTQRSSSGTVSECRVRLFSAPATKGR